MTGRAPAKRRKSPDPEAENLVTTARSLRDFEGRKGKKESEAEKSES